MDCHQAYFVVENGDADATWTFDFYVTEDDCTGQVVSIDLSGDETSFDVSLGGPGEITWFELDVSTTAGKFLDFEVSNWDVSLVLNSTQITFRYTD